MKFVKGIILVILLSFLYPENTNAQCPMCRIGVESNLKNGGTTGKGLNAGILYLLVTPYLLVGGLVFVWWKNKKKAADLEIEETLNSLN